MPGNGQAPVKTVEQMLVQAEQLARTDTSMSKEQHFAPLLTAEPAAYEACLQAQSRSEGTE
jgi:hypothetical protein